MLYDAIPCDTMPYDDMMLYDIKHNRNTMQYNYAMPFNAMQYNACIAMQCISKVWIGTIIRYSHIYYMFNAVRCDVIRYDAL